MKTKRRSRSSVISYDKIAQAALEILEDGGPDALSFRNLARSLNVDHTNIYRRCGNFDGLLDICADYVARDFPEFSDEHDWVAATQLRFEAAYEMWSKHVDLILLRRGRAWLGENISVRFYEPGMRGMIDGGLTKSEAGTLFTILYRLTIGSVMTTKANHWDPANSLKNIEKLGVERFPTIVEVEREMNSSNGVESIGKIIRKLIVDFDPRNRVST